MNLVATNSGKRIISHILHDKPGHLRLFHASLKLWNEALSEGAYPCSRKGENFGPVVRGRNQKRLWCNLFPEGRKAWPATFPDGKQAGLGHQRSHWISADLFSRAGFVSTYQTSPTVCGPSPLEMILTASTGEKKASISSACHISHVEASHPSLD